MWSPLGSSTIGSASLRSSLSENSIPLLMYKSNQKKNRSPTVSFSQINEDEEEGKNSRSSSSSSSSGRSSEQPSSLARAPTPDSRTASSSATPPAPPPRYRRHAKTPSTEDHDARTLTPGADPGANRPLGKGRCVSMPSVVSTPVTPRHQQLLLLQQQQNQGPLGHAKTGGSHHRRFLRRFPKVDNKEALVNHYSCALVADILLQGILYVGERHFAFYSNILGYKKRLLIPAHDVLKVTKERTAKFIPNAVGIATADDKFVFASLLSRDATYKAMHQVWSQCMDLDISLLEDSDTENASPVPQRGSEEEEDLEEEEDSSPSEVGVLPDGTADNCILETAGQALLATSLQNSVDGVHKGNGDVSLGKSKANRMEEVCVYLSKLPRTSLLLLTSTLLLVVLFASASVLVYRIAVVQKQLTTTGPDMRLHPETPAHRWKAYQELSRRQNKVLSEEVGRLTTRLQEHVKHLHQMRLPLEELAATASKLPDFCVSPPNTAKPPQQQTHRQQQEQPQSQWATFAAA